MAASAPSEITELARSSAAVSERARQAIPPVRPSEEALSVFRDAILDIHADALAFYKIAVLEARRAENADEVAAIWKEVLWFARAMTDGWKHLQSFEPTTQVLVDR
jgi:hypothetical protein